MKRAIVLCLALIVSLFAVTGSIAYFTDNITTTNVVEAGNLHILQHEYERVKDGNGFVMENRENKLQPYTQKQAIYPGVETEGEVQKLIIKDVSYDINKAKMNGFVDKIVVAENGGTLGAYVRTFVAVPAYYKSSDTSKLTFEDSLQWIHLDWNTKDWDVSLAPILNQDIGGVKYDIWYATNKTLLKPGAVSAPSLLGYYLDSQVNHNGTNYTLDGVNLGSDSSLTILVATEAAQAIPTGIGDSPRAGAVESLNTTYSGKADVDPGPNRHPWADSNIKTVKSQAELKTELTNATYNTQIGLANGSYELPETLPAGVRIFAMGDAVKLTAKDGKFSAQDVEFDSVTFTTEVTFTGWGAFENCTFLENFYISETSGQVIFSKCVFKKTQPTASETIIYKD